MIKSCLTNIGLLLLIAVLFWLTQREPTITASPQLTQISAETITRIHITRPHNNILLEKSPSNHHWQLTQPIVAPANPNRIQFVLDLLSTPIFSQQSTKTNLSPFGLSPAKIQLQLDQHLFEFGNTAPLNKQRYLRHKEHIYLIADRIYPLLLANPSSFIDNQLIPKKQRLLTVSWSNINSLEGGYLSQAEGHWTSSNTTLNADQIASLLTTWQHAQASSLRILDTPADNTGATLTLHLADEANPHHYQIQLTGKEILLQQVGHRLQYHFPLSIQSQLFPVNTSVKPNA